MGMAIDVKPIRTEADHAAAMAEVARLGRRKWVAGGRACLNDAMSPATPA